MAATRCRLSRRVRWLLDASTSSMAAALDREDSPQVRRLARREQRRLRYQWRWRCSRRRGGRHRMPPETAPAGAVATTTPSGAPPPLIAGAAGARPATSGMAERLRRVHRKRRSRHREGELSQARPRISTPRPVPQGDACRPRGQRGDHRRPPAPARRAAPAPQAAGSASTMDRALYQHMGVRVVGIDAHRARHGRQHRARRRRCRARPVGRPDIVVDVHGKEGPEQRGVDFRCC